MTRHSRFPDAAFVASTAPDFAFVLEKLQTNEQLSGSRARDLQSSVRRVAQIIRPDRPLADLPADPEWCRIQIAKVLPISVGISLKTWSNLTSNFGKALVAAGITPHRFEIKLTGEWAILWRRIRDTDNMQLTTGLSRFPRFCQQAGLQPEDVTDCTVTQYAEALRSSDLTGTPEGAVYHAVRAWNLAIDQVEGWPQRPLTPPDRSRSYALPWAAFPISLEADVDAWLAMGSDDDIFSRRGPRRTLAPATVKLRKGSIQRFATSLVNAGQSVERLTELWVLVQPEMAEIGLRWLHERSERKLGGGLGNIAIAVKMAAKHWVALPKTDLDILATFAQRLSATEPGMTEKNRARMSLFKDPRTLLKLLRLPDTLSHQAQSVKDAARRAALFETATAIAIMITCPIRFDNLCSLEIDTHFAIVGRGRNQRLTLRIPKAMVKNRVDLIFEVPSNVASKIAEFKKVHRPVLSNTRSRYLFTKRSEDAPIGWTTLRRRITDAIRKNVGVEFTPHNFRHLAGFIYLHKYPGGYEMARRLLAHKNGSTTLDHYVGLENDAAHKSFTQLLTDLLGADRG